MMVMGARYTATQESIKKEYKNTNICNTKMTLTMRDLKEHQQTEIR